MASLEEIGKYICVICQELLLEPVVLPCNHTACLYCLEQTLDHNKYQCFLCRKSIQSWYRKTRRSKCLVNTELNDEIRHKFADLLEKRLNGESLDIVPTVRPKLILSDPGEIKRDFDSEFARLQEEIEKKKEKDNKLSEELIQQITEEENRIRLEEEEKLKRDEEIARELALQLNASDSVNAKIRREEENRARLEEEERLKRDEEIARELARQLNPSDTVEPNDTTMQLDSDEALARELARRDSVIEFPPQVDTLPKNTAYSDSMHESLKRSRIEEFTHPLHSPGRAKSDEGLTRKLPDSYKATSGLKSKVSPRTKQLLKKIPTTKYGPMDRFVGFRHHREEHMRKD